LISNQFSSYCSYHEQFPAQTEDGRIVNNCYALCLNVILISIRILYYFHLPKPGQKTVTVSGKALEELEHKYKAEKIKHPNLSFATFISESALIELERRKMLRETQFISLVGFSDDAVILKDVRKGDRLIEVQIRNKNLKCITEDKFDCIHVGFALALPEVRKALNR
jgi:hypothetical protein